MVSCQVIAKEGAAGIAFENNGRIEDCQVGLAPGSGIMGVRGKILSDYKKSISPKPYGGIVGNNNASGTVVNCKNYQQVGVAGNDSTGGTIGRIGGIAGYNAGTIENCENRANVYAYALEDIYNNEENRVGLGGIVGVQRSTGILKDCFSAAYIDRISKKLDRYESQYWQGCIVGAFEDAAISTDISEGGYENSCTGTLKNAQRTAFSNISGCSFRWPEYDSSASSKNNVRGAVGLWSNPQHIASAEPKTIISYSPTDGENTDAYAIQAEYAPGITVTTRGRSIQDAVRTVMADSVQGEGTEEKPYLIGTEEDLKAYRDYVNDGGPAAYARLTEDITVTDKNWEGIGTLRQPFFGEFDGNGKSVTLDVKRNLASFNHSLTKNVTGLFGFNCGTIRNLTVKGSVSGGQRVGAVAGVNGDYYPVSTRRYSGARAYRGVIENCVNEAEVRGTSYVGGIVGMNVGGMDNHLYENRADGLSQIIGCRNEGIVGSADFSSLDGGMIGGIAGYSAAGNITNCQNTAEISGERMVGGIVGKVGGDASTEETYLRVIQNCGNTGNVKFTGEENFFESAGIGAIAGEIQDEYNPQEIKIETIFVNCNYLMDAETNYELPGVGNKEVKQYEGAITYTDNTTPEVPAEPEEFKNGAGTEEAPYLIENLNNFLYFAQNHEKGTYYKLEADIDLKGNEKNPWTPIGSGEKPFEGTFNGNGHTVSGLAVSDNTKDNQGLFGVNAGTIENLTVEGSVTGKDNVGGIAGTNTAEGIIRDCIGNAEVSGENNVGGIVGKNEGSVIRCATKTDGKTESGSGTADKGSVAGTGTNTGGIAGSNDGVIKDSTNNADVAGGTNTGGVTGSNGNSGTVLGSGNNGNITSSDTEGGRDNTGGLVGKNENEAGDSVSGSYKKDENTNKDLSGIGGKEDTGDVQAVTGDVKNPQKPFEGSGTVKDPYKIKTEDDLKKLADLVNSGEEQKGIHYTIEAEGGITLTEKSRPWTPIGTEEHPFDGTFDGDGNTVRGLEINDNAKDNQGLFGVNAGTIENLTVEGSVAGHDNVGGIAGTNMETGAIKDCTADVTVSGHDNVGGIAGKNDGSVTGCTNKGTVTGTGSNAGGITGTNNGNAEGNTNKGTVSGKDNTGGIMGTSGTDGTVKDNTNSGNVTGENGQTTGAVIGKNENPDLNDITGNYYQKTDETNNGLTGIGGVDPDPAGISSGTNPAPEKYFEEKGTEEDPYQIESREDLEALRDSVNGGNTYKDNYFEITSDIDLGGEGNPWTPIGTAENPFKGTLNGNGHTVSGLHINDKTKDDQGLFGVNAGTVGNLTVAGNVTGKDNVGGIAGTNTADGTIKDCTSSVTVTGENNVGGIVGKNDGTITDCTNNGSVAGTGNNVGGIAGNNTGTVNGSNNTGAVNGNNNVGGIIGSNTGTVNGSDNTGAVSGNNNVGGITGNNTGTVEESKNTGAVTGTGTGAGGIAGTNNGSLDNDINTAPVTGKDDVGGIAGTNGGNGTVEGCTNSGNVTGNGDSVPGAIIGNNQNTDPGAVKDDYYQKTEEINKDLTGIGEGTGSGTDPEGITSGQTPINPEKPFNGSGTAEDPYKIAGKDDLENLRDLINGGKDFTDVHFEVTKDIDLGGSGENPWTPIGTAENPFKGTLDGNGHTVSGLHINDKMKDDQGLFGVNAGTIENLAVAGSVTGKDNVGGIAGVNTESGVIKDCTSNVTVSGENNAGGIAGKNDGTITDCVNNGSVTGTGNNVGGITGNNTGTVEGNKNSGAVTGTGTGTGGIAGTNNGSLDNDTNIAPVTGKDDVGGIAGTNGGNGTVEGCTNSGNVTASGDGGSTPGAVIGNNQNANPDAVKDDYYQKTEEINKDLTGIGEGTGSGTDPEGITSGQTPTNPGQQPSVSDQAAAKAFEDGKIAAIVQTAPEGGDAWKKAVKDAREAFDSLTDSQKNLVSENAKNILVDAEAILKAVEKIEAIGTVANTPESAGKIKDARDSYNGLTIQQKNQFPPSVLKKLSDAEKAYAALLDGNGGAGNPALSPEQQKQVDEIAEKLGVSRETAQKIQAIAEELGVDPETLLLMDGSFTGSKSESDIKGSEFAKLSARAAKVTKNKVTQKWKKIKGADGYLIYGARCGTKKNKLLKTINKNGQTSFTHSKLKKGKGYRYVVRAYKMVDGKRITISASKTVHVFADGGKYGNAKTIKLKKSKAVIKAGKTFKISAKEIKKKKPLRKHRQICYESSNKNVATVTKKGVIKGMAKGTCKIYVYAQNGICKTVKVTVK